MSLLDLKLHLQQTKISSMFELSNRFNCDPALLRDKLQHWIRKGRVKVCTKTPRCGTICQSCSPLLTEMYQWVDETHYNNQEA